MTRESRTKLHIPTELLHRPSVHQLCSGAFIQGRAAIEQDVLAVPLVALGFGAEAERTIRYAAEVLGAEIDQRESLREMEKQGNAASPVVVIVVRNRVDAAPEDLERIATPLLDRARTVLAWATGEIPQPFAFVTATVSGTFFRMIPPRNRQRYRLGFGNTGADFESQLSRISKLAGEDQRFAFALSMFREALREEDSEFRVARHFACLEALAYRIKGSGSRKRVRELLGLKPGAMTQIGGGGNRYTFDRIEIGGRIRDKLFHGAPFRSSDLNQESKDAYEHLLATNRLGDLLLDDCEMEFARWANGKSRGQARIPPT